MNNIYPIYPKKYSLSRSTSLPLFNSINSGNKENTKLQIKLMEEHLKRLEKENKKQEEQINAIISFRNRNNKNILYDLNTNDELIFYPNNYTNQLDKYNNMSNNPQSNNWNFYSLSKINKEKNQKRKIKKYKENIIKLKEMLHNERIEKKINNFNYRNMCLKLKMDINNFMHKINHSFQEKIKKDNLVNNSIKEINEKYGEIKNIFKNRLNKLELRHKKEFDDIQSSLLNQIKNIKNKEKTKREKINKKIKDNFLKQREIDNFNFQKELNKFKSRQELDDIDNKKLYEEIKYEKLKRDILSQRDKIDRIPNIIQYPLSFRYPYDLNYL